MKVPDGATYLSLPQIFPTGGTGTVRDIDARSWFSVLQPVRAQAPAGTRVRQYNVQPGANVAWTPGSESTSSHGFAILREVADSWDLLRIVIETVKDRLCSVPWDLRIIAQPGDKQIDLQQRTAEDPRIAKLKAFLKKPDGMRPWRDWLRTWLEDILVLDAGAIYLERDLKGRVASIPTIDGSTIERVLTDQGFTPQGMDANGKRDVAYQQILYGVPAIDLTVDDLIYTMRNPRTWKRYGYGPVEQMLVTIAIGISRQRFTLNEYKEGNIPEALCFLPNDVPLDKVKEAQDWFDSVFAGNLQKRRRLTFLPGFGTSETTFRPNVVFTKQQLMKDPFDEWQFQLIAYGLGTTPQAMLKMMNRASAQSTAESAEEEGLEPKLRTIEDVINDLIQNKMGFDDIEFSYQQRRETDGLKQMEIDTGYSSKAVITLNEARVARGMDPYDSSKFPEADEPGVFTPNGWMPLSVASQIQRQQQLISAGVVQDPQSPPTPPAPAQPGDKKDDSDSKSSKKPSGKTPKKQPKVTPAKAPVKLYRMQTSKGDVLVSESKEALVKSAKRTGALYISPSYSDSATKAAKSVLRDSLEKVFRRQKDRATHFAAGILQKFSKADDDFDSAEADALAKQIYDSVNEDFKELPSQTKAALEDSVLAGINKGIADISLADSGMIAALNRIAADWASTRAAEMVGMKYNEEGVLVPNPNAQWVISETTRTELRDIIKAAFEKETPLEGLIADIQKAGAFSDARAEMIARTEVSFAQVSGNWEVWKSTGLVESVQWAISEDDNVCDECEENDEEIVGFGEEFPSGDQMPPAHPMCLIGGTEVSAGGISAATKRWFHGKVVSIRVETDDCLTVTPNHPVLTNRGWLGAGAIKNGDYLVHCSDPDVFVSTLSCPSNNMVKSRVEDVSDSLRESSFVRSVSMEVSPEDFHGDGGIVDRKNKVDIVFTASDLTGQLKVREVFKHKLSKTILGSRHSRRFTLDSARSFAKRMWSMFTSERSSVGRFGQPFSVAHAGISHSIELGGGFGSYGEAGFTEPTADSKAVTSDAFSYLDARLAGLVSLVKVKNVNAFDFSGHVYNLQTEHGYYLANSLVTHNCQCTIFAVGMSDDDDAEKARAFGKYNPYHEPAGSSIGGQFASAEGGSTSPTQEFKLADGRKLTLSKEPNERRAQIIKFRDEETKKLPPEVQKGIEEGKQTEEMYKGADGKYTPERQALHDKIIGDYMKGHEAQAEPKLTFVGGGPAAGKTTASDEAAASMGDHIYLNVDDIRTQMPEFNACLPDRFVSLSNEIGDIRDQVIVQAKAARYNMIIDGVGSGSAAESMTQMEGQGYKAAYTYVHRDVEDAIGRAQARPYMTKNISNLREVPEGVVRESYNKARTNFGKLADGSREVKVYDKSSDSFGKEGKLVYWKGADGTVKTYDAEGVNRVANGGTPKITWFEKNSQ